MDTDNQAIAIARRLLEMRRKWPQLHPDAFPVPPGLQPREGVEYGCGDDDCEACYEPEVTK
jgi:hypothetical protein